MIGRKISGSFYMNNRASDIYRAVKEEEGYGGWSRWMCEAMKLHYLYPNNIQEMLDRGLDNLNQAEETVFNAFMNDAIAARRERMKKLEETPEPT